MLDFLLGEPFTHSNDKEGRLAVVCIDLFFDFAEELEKLKSQQAPKENQLQFFEYMGGVGYVLCMLIGNDVIFFSNEDKLRVYTQVKKAFYQRMTNIRFIQYIAHIVEALFAYQKVTDDDDDESEISMSEAEESSTEEPTLSKKTKNNKKD